MITRAIPRAALGSLGQQLIAMSGQFEQRRLASATHQLELLDAFVGPEQVAHRDEARRLWRELGTTRRGVEQARERAGELESRRHELEALVDVVEGLDVGSEDRLRSERTTLLRVADLTAAVAEATELLSPEAGEAPGAADLTVRAADALGKVQDVDAGLDRTRCELQAAAVVLREATSAIRSYLTSLEADPARLEHVEHELQRIADARRRYGCADVAELIDEAEAAQALLDASGATSPLVAMEKELAELERRAAEASRELRACRVEKAAAFGDAVRSELERLGLGPGDLVGPLGARPPGPTGSDRVDFMLQANAGLDHAPVASTASGGELSRIALALRVVAHAQAGESTIVFDEIDAGIGGTTAHAVAESLGRLAERAQVIAITHLPQVASAANQHLRVEKVGGDPAHTTIEVLRGDERRRELERMLGGMEFVSSVAAEGARRDS
ncbi:MAG: hypothetical protein ACE5EV_05865 [Gaiellales bacterium]